MTVTPQARAARLGYFVGFMQAWGEASPSTRETFAGDVATYTAGGEDGTTLLWQAAVLLGVPFPQPASGPNLAG